MGISKRLSCNGIDEGNDMNDTFRNKWNKIKNMNINEVSDLILTGKSIETFPDSEWLPSFLRNDGLPITILDFGCGIGRNSFYLAEKLKNCKIVGYDSEDMISRIPEFRNLRYKGENFPNLYFTSKWEELKIKRFDRIICILVLQHIYEKDLTTYISDFKRMTSFLLVHGRRFNDDVNRRSVWKILEENHLVPSEFYSGHIRVEYLAEGDPNEHNCAYYFL